MTTPRSMGGSVMVALVAKGLRANSQARESLRRILDERPGPQTQAALIARAAIGLGECAEALVEIQQIAAKAKAK